jgi:hypothetical protein
MIASTIPITVTDEAKEFIAQLGTQREFEQMLEHTLQSIPDLRSIEVVLDPDLSGEIGPGIVMWAHRPDTGDAEDPTNWNWGAWKVRTFPPEMPMDIVMLSFYE